MTKTYKCKLSATGVVVNVNGRAVRCEFEAGVLSPTGLRGCVYTTDNKDIQKAIESLSFFNQSHLRNYIWTDDVEEKIVVEEKHVVEEEPIVVEEKVEDVIEEVAVEEKPIVKRGRKAKAE